MGRLLLARCWPSRTRFAQPTTQRAEPRSPVRGDDLEDVRRKRDDQSFPRGCRVAVLLLERRGIMVGKGVGLHACSCVDCVSDHTLLSSVSRIGGPRQGATHKATSRCLVEQTIFAHCSYEGSKQTPSWRRFLLWSLVGQ